MIIAGTEIKLKLCHTDSRLFQAEEIAIVEGLF